MAMLLEKGVTIGEPLMVVMGNESNSWLLSPGKVEAYNKMIWKNS